MPCAVRIQLPETYGKPIRVRNISEFETHFFEPLFRSFVDLSGELDLLVVLTVRIVLYSKFVCFALILSVNRSSPFKAERFDTIVHSLFTLAFAAGDTTVVIPLVAHQLSGAIFVRITVPLADT